MTGNPRSCRKATGYDEFDSVRRHHGFKSRNSVAFFFYKMVCSVGSNMNALHSYAVTENPRSCREATGYDEFDSVRRHHGFKSRNSVAFFFYKMVCSVGSNMNALHSYAVTENPRSCREATGSAK